jgi:hypothetical protein
MKFNLFSDLVFYETTYIQNWPFKFLDLATVFTIDNVLICQCQVQGVQMSYQKAL